MTYGYTPELYPTWLRSTVLLFAAMKDKPADEMLEILCPLARKVIVTRVPVPRGETPETLRRLALAG